MQRFIRDAWIFSDVKKGAQRFWYFIRIPITHPGVQTKQDYNISRRDLHTFKGAGGGAG